ncbi:MAG: GNAT family N-acetyltransferase, partial [Actinobacteria bacterium]|nr:GNAT family N-acetyltransferase [Actinomycetota bacterium]
MSASRLAPADVMDRALAAADAAAVKAGVTVCVLDEQADIDSMVALFARVWDINGSEPVITSSLARAFAHSGNYVSAAFRDGQMLGASVGFLGQDQSDFHLHSHVTGVGPSVQTKGVGFVLKQHQRAWALERGLRTIRWTFDPLVSRNGYFNITKLGAEIVGYYPNFYGAMLD